MPFKSKKQWKYFFANKDIPKSMARKWALHTKKKYKKLPDKVKSSSIIEIFITAQTLSRAVAKMLRK